MKKHSFGCLLFLFIFGDLIAQKLDCPYQIQVCVIGAQPFSEIIKPLAHAEIFTIVKPLPMAMAWPALRSFAVNM
ncbi:MAG: hypothetical protein RLZZ47_1582 [Bacteroidota bacterium]